MRPFASLCRIPISIRLALVSTFVGFASYGVTGSVPFALFAATVAPFAGIFGRRIHDAARGTPEDDLLNEALRTTEQCHPPYLCHEIHACAFCRMIASSIMEK